MKSSDLRLKLNEAMAQAQAWQKHIKTQQDVITDRDATIAQLKAQVASLLDPDVDDDLSIQADLLVTTIKAGADWPIDSPIPDQQPPVIPPVIPPVVIPSASPENTRAVRVVADDLAVWTLDSANNTMRNGVAVGGGIAIGYLKLNGIYCYAGNMYFKWTGTAWAAPVGDPTVIVPPNLMPTIGLTTSVLVATDPGSVLISTTPADPDGTVTKVELFDNGGLIATLTQAPYTYTHMNVSAGPHSYTGKVYDNSTGTAISAASLVTINPVVVPPTIVDPIPVQII